MPNQAAIPAIQSEQPTDEQVVARVLEGETALFEVIMRRYNQRLYRIARAILRDEAEAEDVMQEAYVRAFQNLAQFAGRAQFSTWLSRIAVNEALSRLRRRGRNQELDAMEDPGMLLVSHARNPEQRASQSETRGLLEEAVDALPANYRTVVMMRDMEEMSTAEVAECLGITEQNVKVRLHRAHALLRRELLARTGARAASAFQFEAPRCDRVVAAVFARLAKL